MNDNIKNWYIKTFPTDDLGSELSDSITFNDLFETLDRYKDVYKCLGVDDSLVRERCFARLSELMNVDYNYIYDQWLLG